jgi:hypothetical protein
MWKVQSGHWMCGVEFGHWMCRVEEEKAGVKKREWKKVATVAAGASLGYQIGFFFKSVT